MPRFLPSALGYATDWAGIDFAIMYGAIFNYGAYDGVLCNASVGYDTQWKGLTHCFEASLDGATCTILFPPDASASIVQAIPGAVFSVIVHAAHSIHMEQPQVFTECVLDFLLSKKMADRKGHQ